MMMVEVMIVVDCVSHLQSSYTLHKPVGQSWGRHLAETLQKAKQSRLPLFSVYFIRHDLLCLRYSNHTSLFPILAYTATLPHNSSVGLYIPLISPACGPVAPIILTLWLPFSTRADSARYAFYFFQRGYSDGNGGNGFQFGIYITNVPLTLRTLSDEKGPPLPKDEEGEANVPANSRKQCRTWRAELILSFVGRGEKSTMTSLWKVEESSFNTADLNTLIARNLHRRYSFQQNPAVYHLW